MKHTLYILFASAFFALSASARELYIYNFGRLAQQTPAEQVEQIKSHGYGGLVVSVEGSRVPLLDGYIEAAEEAEGENNILAAFTRYKFEEPEVERARWRYVLEKIAGRGIDLWYIIGKPKDSATDEQVEQILAEVADAAKELGVNVVLYPHSKCYIESAEEGLPFVQRLNRPNLGLAVHLYHEIRAGNGDRIEEVVQNVAPYIRAVTLAGTEPEADFTTPLSMDMSTIQLLDQGSYDLGRFVRAIESSGYRGPYTLMNFTFKEDPADYLDRCLAFWRNKLDPDLEAFDAPDQAVWHAPSKTWFVSNLGGGISLARDGYGWIARLDADGKVLSPRWLDGFDAPSGMIATPDTLYVCDRDGLAEVDIASASIRKMHLIQGGLFINDVALAANGDLFVSDFSANRIYRIPQGGTPEIFLEDGRLDTPDGLLIIDNNLIVGTWGPIIEPASFKTSRPGTMLSIDLKTKEITPYNNSGSVGNMEGLTRANGAIYATDWMRGALIRETATGWEDVLTGLKNPTDPGYAPELGIVAVPEHTGNRVLFLQVGQEAPLD